MRTHRLLAALVGAVLTLPLAAAPPPQLIILEAAANTQTGVLTIVGVNLGGSTAKVNLAGQTLAVQSATDAQIVATLPSLPAGAYLLRVSRGPATVDQDTFSLNIGTGGAGGDIESIAVGEGLLGGGASGDVSVEVDEGWFDAAYLRRDGSNNGPFARLDVDNHFLGNQSISGFTQMSGFNASAPSFVQFTQPDARALEVNNFAPTGCNGGVHATVMSQCAAAVVGGALGPSGGTGGSFGSRGDGGVGVAGSLEHPTGGGIAVLGLAVSPAAVVAEFQHFGNGVLINGVDANHIVFQVAGDGTVTATDFVNSSSARYKTNVAPLDGALARIERLRPVTFDWKSTGKPDIGLIAEEVAEVVPDAVAFDAEGANGVDYQDLTALLIQAVQEQQVQIRELQRQLGLAMAPTRP